MLWLPKCVWVGLGVGVSGIAGMGGVGCVSNRDGGIGVVASWNWVWWGGVGANE